MSTKDVLVLMAGGYPNTAIQKHLLSVNGSYLFERIISAVPVKNVWIVHNQNTQGFWNGWYAREVPKEFSDKAISFFLDKQNTKGEVTNPSLWMTSSIPSLLMNFEKEAVIYSAIDTYFENFNFVDKLLSKDNAFVVGRASDGERYVANMLKTTTKNLLVNGQLPKGNMFSVAEMMTKKGTKFEVVKTDGSYANINSSEDLHKAQSSYSIENKVIL